MASTVYLVGGAVRDELLDLPVTERDWVVVGSTPEEMEAKGFRQVGASFPVFLHPKSHEEYALARTERKQGHGYHGFAVDFHPGVTLEQDLERRDLTINAIAKDDQGQLIDPFHGVDDLKAGVLRHVSPAFSEDPLRVLRVARFAARFAAKGFAVHPETMALMKEMVLSGELDHLVAERVCAELEKALMTDMPGSFVQVLYDCGALKVLFPEVHAMFGVPQRADYHPEVDTGVHLMLALNQVVKLSDQVATRFAVFTHDLGKALTPEDVLPGHRGHEQAGLPLVEQLCQRIKAPRAWRDLAMKVCAYHLRCHMVFEMRPAKVVNLLEDLGAFRQLDHLQGFVRACEADYRGRTGFENRDYPQADYLLKAGQAAARIRARHLGPEYLGKKTLADLSGPEVGDLLRRARIDVVRQLPVQPPE